MANSLPTITMALDPSGPLGNLFNSIDHAGECGRELERTGLWIKHGDQAWEGTHLRELLGDTTPAPFDAFPVSTLT